MAVWPRRHSGSTTEMYSLLGPDEGPACLHYIPDQTAGETVTHSFSPTALKRNLIISHKEEVLIYCSFLAFLSSLLLFVFQSFPPLPFFSFLSPSPTPTPSLPSFQFLYILEPEGFFFFFDQGFICS